MTYVTCSLVELPVSKVCEGVKMGALKASVLFLRAMLASKASLKAEHLALRQQVSVLGQSRQREAEPPDEGDVISIPQVGGLHHRYTRRAA